MSQIYKTQTGSSPSGPVVELTPDVGAVVIPDGSGNINLTGAPTGAGSSSLDSNFETFNAGTSTMQFAHRYQNSVTTSDGAGQTQTILTVPVTVSTAMSVHAQVAGIEASIPSGVGGSIDGAVFRGGGGATTITTANKYIDVSSSSINGCDLNVSVSGNNLIVTVTGVATFTIEWYCIATIVQKSFI